MLLETVFVAGNVAAFLHYSLICILIIFTIIGVSIAPSRACKAAIIESNIQPAAYGDIKTTLLLGTAMIETMAVIGGLTALLMSRQAAHSITIYTALAEIGIILAVCIAGLTFGLSCTLPIGAACAAIARQPLLASKITRYMLFSLCILVTPLLLSSIIALIICYQAPNATTLPEALRLIGAGTSIGLSSIGPIRGLSILAQSGCHAFASNKNAYQQIMNNTMISQAIIETPIILAFVISIFILFTLATTIEGSIGLCSAALCIGLGTLGSAINSSYIASYVCKSLAKDPTSENRVPRFGMLYQFFIEACAIYSFIISLLLIWYH